MDIDLLLCDVSPEFTSWSTLFQINGRSAHLSFSAVKLIDIAWDLLVGRVGQFVLATISYHVFSMALLRVTEEHAVSYDLFATLTLESPGLGTVYETASAVFRQKHWRSIAMIVWMALAAAYVLAFPTLLSASTSYVSATTTNVRLNDETTKPLSSFIDTACFVFRNTTGIHNSSGIDVPDPWFVPLSNFVTLPSWGRGDGFSKYMSRAISAIPILWSRSLGFC